MNPPTDYEIIIPEDPSDDVDEPTIIIRDYNPLIRESKS